MRQLLVVWCLVAPAAAAQMAPPRQTQADDYTRYELLEPGSAKFRILYEVTATTPGATEFFNVIRKGSVASDEHVSDRMTGRPLAFDEVGADIARAGGVRNPDSTTRYIRVRLARAVPQGGEGRILIDKTYYDPRSYYEQNDEIVFDRPLGIKRNAVVLPAGYELVSCNYPSQILREADGRLAVSFWNNTPAEAPLVLRARRGNGAGAGATVAAAGAARTPRPASLRERAHENRKIVYFLQQPETHAFDLYHDYTESRPGIDHYVNVVRGGSHVSSPHGMVLDTGDSLRTEILRGAAIQRARVGVDSVTPDMEVVVFRFAPPSVGGSIRLRMFETYTDSARYRLDGDELIWDRSFGRAPNVVVLPQGWALSNSTIPATVSTSDDGRVRLEFINPRPDDIAVYVTAHRR